MRYHIINFRVIPQEKSGIQLAKRNRCCNLFCLRQKEFAMIGELQRYNVLLQYLHSEDEFRPSIEKTVRAVSLWIDNHNNDFSTDDVKPLMKTCSHLSRLTTDCKAIPAINHILARILEVSQLDEQVSREFKDRNSAMLIFIQHVMNTLPDNQQLFLKILGKRLCPSTTEIEQLAEFLNFLPNEQARKEIGNKLLKYYPGIDDLLSLCEVFPTDKKKDFIDFALPYLDQLLAGDQFYKKFK